MEVERKINKLKKKDDVKMMKRFPVIDRMYNNDPEETAICKTKEEAIIVLLLKYKHLRNCINHYDNIHVKINHTPRQTPNFIKSLGAVSYSEYTIESLKNTIFVSLNF